MIPVHCHYSLIFIPGGGGGGGGAAGSFSSVYFLMYCSLYELNATYTPYTKFWSGQCHFFVKR